MADDAGAMQDPAPREDGERPHTPAEAGADAAADAELEARIEAEAALGAAGPEAAGGSPDASGLPREAAYADDPDPGESATAARPTIRSSRPLDAAEIDGCLRATRWGVLATVEEDGPYAVPVVFGYDGRHIYVASVAGRKMRNIDANPSVCLTIADVAPRMARWRSVVVRGTARQLRDPVGLTAAMRALRRNIALPVTVKDLARLARARVFRIDADELTGRATG